MSGFPARINTSADAIRAGFEHNDLDTMSSQDGCSTKASNAGTDYDDFFCVREICLPFLLTHNTSLRHNGHRFFRVSTTLQLFGTGICSCRQEPVSELQDGRRTRCLLRFVGRKMSDVEMLSHSELTSRHSLVTRGSRSVGPTW